MNKERSWECGTCHAAGAVRWSEHGNLYELRGDGSRGRKIGIASIWSKWMTDRFGPQTVCQLCGALSRLADVHAERGEAAA